jgi:hypothetical protein
MVSISISRETLWPRRSAMSGFLLDTNIPSELTRLKSAPEVERWLDKANNAELYFSVISLGEILKGITVLPASKRRDGLQEWLDGTLRPWFEGRILPVTAPIAERWAFSPENAGCKENRSKSRMDLSLPPPFTIA